MKAAVVGGGSWGKNLVRTLSAIGRLHSVVESNRETRNALVSQYPGLQAFASVDELLGTDFQAACVATPAHTHYELAQRIIESGRDVMVEKPLTLNSQEADALVQLAKQKGRILMVGHLLLYQPAVRFIKESIARGLVGEVHSIHQERLNLGRARAHENVLWSFGVHDVAVLLYLCGEVPAQVVGVGQSALQASIEDDFYLHMRFPSGRQAHIHSSWLWPELRRRLTVVGSEGMLVYDEPDQQVVYHRKSIDKELKNKDNGMEVLFEGSSEPLRLELEHFLECCESRESPLSDGASGVEVLRVMEQAKAK